MKIKITFILLLMLNVFVFSEKTEMETYLEKSEKAFQAGLDLEEDNYTESQKKYSESILYLEKIIKDGKIRNAKLYYNLANSYFKTSNMGKALLNYKRALILRPYDKNIISSYNYAKNNLKEVLPESDFSRILRLVFFIHYKLAFHYKIIIFTIFYLLFWTLIFVYYLKRKKKIVKLSVIFFVFFLLFLISFSYDYYSTKNTGVIIKNTTARKGDSYAYKPSFSEELLAGTEFNLKEKRNNWFLIKLETGVSCWVKSEHVELVFSKH